MKTLRFVRLWALLSCVAATTAMAADAPASPPPLEAFIRPEQFLDVKISPTGEYLAASVMITEDTGGLAILDRETQKVVGTFRLAGRSYVSEFHWVNDERVVLTAARKNGALSEAYPTGEIYATDWNGKNQDVLVGRSDGDTNFSHIKKRNVEVAFASIVDTLPDDDKFMLISVSRPTSDEGTFPTLERLNVKTGSRSIVARAPVLNARYVLDGKSQVRFAQGNDLQSNTKLYYRANDDAEWELINDQAANGRILVALGFSADGGTAYLRGDAETGPDVLYAWDVKTHERKRVGGNPRVDPAGLVYTHDGVTPYAVYYFDGKPSLQLLDGNVPEAKLLRALIPSFPGEWVSFTSFTADGAEAVFEVSSDRNPGQFFLLDKQRRAQLVQARRSWIDPETMAEMTPIELKARDGRSLYGYLTLPPGSKGKNVPLIIHPHGGPHGVRDHWGFNAEVQLFASRGYAVLQVNFRGSGGYGSDFEAIGYRHWGTTMQDDLTDATRWAIDQGIADPKRICIYGASYGGYAAAMGTVREPELYRCAVGYVGVYDLRAMYRNPGAYNNDTSENLRKRYLGTDQNDLAERSPVNHVDKIKTPILIAAGTDDEIAPIEHSRAMRDGIEKAGGTVDWLVGEREGHGFDRLESRTALYTRMLAWFDRYIGKGQ